MAASLQTLDAAIFAALEALLASNGGQFSSVIRFASPQTGRDQERELNTVALAQTPAAILAFEGETFAVTQGMITAALQNDSFIGTSIWRVYVSHSELAGHDEAVTGQVGSAGVLDLVSRVTNALAGLRIPGLYRSTRLTPVDTRPELIKPGAYIYRLRFCAQRFVEGTEAHDDSVAMQDTVATVFPKFQDVDGNLVDGITPVDFTVDFEP